MLSKDRIIKLEVLLSDEINNEVISATNKQFTFQSSPSGRNDTTVVIKGHDLPTVSSEKEVSVIAYIRSGERIKYPSYISLSIDSQLNVIVQDIPQVMPERRNAFKVKTDLNCIINSIERDGAQMSLKSPIVAHLDDLSIGGTFLVTHEIELNPKDIMSLTILFEKNMNVAAEVLRVQINVEGNIIGYGCRFINLTPAMEETLAKYVFSVQRNNLYKD